MPPGQTSAREGQQCRRGQLNDHVALGVTDLDAWVTKLHREGVIFFAEPYQLGATRAAMIEGPSREAIELVKVKDLAGPPNSPGSSVR